MEYVFSVSSYDEPALDEELALALDARGAMSMKRRGAVKKHDAMKAPSAQACKVRKILGIAVMVLGGLMLLYVTTMQQRSKLLQIAGFLLLGAGLMVMRTANPDAKPAASARARQTAEKLLIALRKTDFAKDLHVRFTDENMTVSTRSKTADVDYAQLHSIAETEHMWFISYGQSGVVLQKKDLEQGSALSFFDDITARAGCPGEVIPWGTDEKNEKTTDNPSDTTTGETL